MAGLGSRFSEAGYSMPKPLIEILGKTMIERVIENFDAGSIDEYVFICRKEHEDMFGIADKLKSSCKGRKVSVFFSDGTTEGAACTILLSRSAIDVDDGIVIANCDQLLEWDSRRFVESCADFEALILTFNSCSEKHSYAKLGEDGLVSEVAEKRVISDHATVGIYFWAKGSDFVRCAERMIGKNVRVNNEFYVCPVFNEAIAEGVKVGITEIERSKIWTLGTPEELDVFLEANESRKESQGRFFP